MAPISYNGNTISMFGFFAFIARVSDARIVNKVPTISNINATWSCFQLLISAALTREGRALIRFNAESAFYFQARQTLDHQDQIQLHLHHQHYDHLPH